MTNNYNYPSLPHGSSGRGPTGGGTTGAAPVKTVLYGRDINCCPVPIHTAGAQNKPVVLLQNDTGTATFGLSMDMLSKHLLLLGGIGTGKTNTYFSILKYLLKAISGKDLVLIFDSKGDFYREFYNPWDPNHIVIGNQREYETKSRCWNIFDELRNPAGKFDNSSILAAKEIAKSLFAGRESSSQPFFCNAATDVVSKVLIDFFRHRPASQLNNAVLVEYFRSANVNAYHDMIDRNPDFESIRDYFGQRGTNLTAQALGVLAYITGMVNDIFIGIFGESRPTGSFSMRQMVREKRENRSRKVVFIEYDLSTGETLGPIYGLLYDLALKEDLGGRNHAGNTFYVCDEFRILPKLNHINDALNLGRSLGVKVLAGLQTINQLYDVYGQELGKTLAAGFMNSMCFQTWDLDTREFISGRFGENYVNYGFHSLNAPISTQREGRVVEDWDILNLRVGEAFVNLAGVPAPFRFRFRQYVERKTTP